MKGALNFSVINFTIPFNVWNAATAKNGVTYYAVWTRSVALKCIPHNE